MDNIEKLWKAMEMDLRQKDNHSDWPYKGIVMVSPWKLQILCYTNACEEHETGLAFVLQNAVRKEDFDESTVNLKSPVLLNTATGVAAQVI